MQDLINYLHVEMRDNHSLTELQKPLLLAALVIKSQGYSISDIFDTETLKELAFTDKLDTSIMEGKVKYYLEHNNHDDLIAELYQDGDGLGIVLTPPHICDLMLRLGGIEPGKTVYDPCTGTGRFLVTAANLGATVTGTELQPSLHIMATANMVLHKQQLPKLGSCFTDNVLADISVLNPPYSQKIKELDFLLHAADQTRPEGSVICIVPKSCFISAQSKKLKQKIMDHHTVEAIVSCPNDLFYPIGTNVAIIVLKARVPHPKDHKTYLYDFSNDGYVMIPKRGRENVNYVERREELLSSIQSHTEIPGTSAYVSLESTDEWIVEAYAEVDYSVLTDADFMKAIIDKRVRDFRDNPFR